MFTVRTIREKAEQERADYLANVDNWRRDRAEEEHKELNAFLDAAFDGATLEDFQREGIELRPIDDDGVIVPCLVGQCCECGKEALSNPVGSWYLLGLYLNCFEPGWLHDCPARKRVNTWPAASEQLRAALIQFLDLEVE